MTERNETFRRFVKQTIAQFEQSLPVEINQQFPEPPEV
jgi:hypothetical protein